MSNHVHGFNTLKPQQRSYLVVLIALLSLALLGYYCAHTMDVSGHHISGMTNRVVWGVPHVFAVSLIVTASGALNGASFATVFGLEIYKPYARISVALAMALLVGGLVILVLDLGRPDRLLVAMTTFNFRSIFAWNIFLYSGFILISGVYLWVMCERRFNRYVKKIGMLAFVWRLVLTTGTGCIFAFLVGRNSLDSALLAPLFIALSLVMGTAAFAIVLLLTARWGDSLLPAPVCASLSRLLFWFVLCLAYFSIAHHLTNLYVAEHRESEHLVLVGAHAPLFWVGHVLLGILLPLLMLSQGSTSQRNSDSIAVAGAAVTETGEIEVRAAVGRRKLLIAALASVVAGGALLYVIIIGSQTTAQRLFPGKTVVASTFGDMGLASYHPSWWEWGLGAGGVSFGLLLFLLSLRVFPFTAVHQSRY